jgi:putative ubiquitin-RnfH superfamily antitoxin RatB of RatAB toxin-antitoxin module
MGEEGIVVEVAYATPERQWLIELEVPPGTSAGEAILLSGILEEVPHLDTTRIGVFGESVDHDHRLQAGDRVEIYRPLITDPKQARRELAGRGKSMGRG